MKRNSKPKATAKGVKFRLKLEVDTSNWGAGEWEYDLAKAMKITTDHDEASVNFEINQEFWEQAALKIAKEAVEAFFDEGMYISLTKDGVSLVTEDGPEFLIGFSKIMMGMGREARDVLVCALNAQIYEDDGSYEPFRLDNLARISEAQAQEPTNV